MRQLVGARRTMVSLALLAMMAAASVLAVAPVSSNGAVAAAMNCADVGFVGARGSGEPFDDKNLDMGKTVVHAFAQYSVRVTDRSVSGAGVVYPAHEVALLAVDGVNRQRKYFEGLDTGVKDVVSSLKSYAKRCPSQRFVLAGYSQGAMVMHRAAWQLAKDRFDLTRIDGVLLIADGDRRPRKGIKQYGSAKNGKGISWVLPDMSGDLYKPREGIPPGLDGRVHSVCLDYDIVCDSNLFHTASLATLYAGIKNHEKYASGRPAAKFVAAAAAAIAEQTMRTPLPTDTPTEVPVDWAAQRDQLLSEVNAARAQSRWCGQVQWPAAAPLQRIPSLDAAAQSYAVRQSTEGFTGHYSPEGLGAVDRAAAEGYTGGLGEDLANGQETAQQVVTAWLSSPGHCQVLMSAASVAGIGFADVTHGTAWGFLGDCSCSGREPSEPTGEN